MRHLKMFPLLDGDEYDYEPQLIFPNQFNPLHNIHLIIAELAKSTVHKECWFEISIKNNTNLLTLMHRLIQFENLDIKKVIFTSSQTLQEKAKMFPNSYIIYSSSVLNSILERSSGDELKILNEKNIKLITYGGQVYRDVLDSNTIITLPNRIK